MASWLARPVFVSISVLSDPILFSGTLVRPLLSLVSIRRYWQSAVGITDEETRREAGFFAVLSFAQAACAYKQREARTDRVVVQAW